MRREPGITAEGNKRENTMNLLLALATDLVAITILGCVLYFRRHRRRDLMLSYVALNVGVVAVTVALGSMKVGVGLGIGLFGILSIIRLRSDQITQQEIAYYFTALALGLLAGLRPSPSWVTPTLSGVLLAVMFVLDHPRLASRTFAHTMTLDRAICNRDQLIAHLSGVLGAEIMAVTTIDVDMVRDTTIVDVRYRLPSTAPHDVATAGIDEAADELGDGHADLVRLADRETVG